MNRFLRAVLERREREHEEQITSDRGVAVSASMRAAPQPAPYVAPKAPKKPKSKVKSKSDLCAECWQAIHDRDVLGFASAYRLLPVEVRKAILLAARKQKLVIPNGAHK